MVMVSVSMAGIRQVRLQPWYEIWAGVMCCVAEELASAGERDSNPVITARMEVSVGLLSYETM